MSFYVGIFLVLTLLSLSFALLERRIWPLPSAASSIALGVSDGAAAAGGMVGMMGEEVGRFKMNYLLVFGLVMASDWLQGPYLFSLYHDEFAYDLHTIAILFVLGFLAAGLSASSTGHYADRYGRKWVCLSFCFLYALSCATKMFRPLFSLALGRLLGGISTSILFSVFESWMVSEARRRGMGMEEIGSFLGRCTLINGVVAAASGMASDVVVGLSGTFKAPFVLSAAFLLIAAGLIRTTWAENFGGKSLDGAGDGQMQSTKEQLMRAFAVLRENPSLIAVAIAMTAYETSLYLFVFLWVPTMQDATNASSQLPLGTLFSSFMVAMTFGSLIYNALLARASIGFDVSAQEMGESYRPLRSDVDLERAAMFTLPDDDEDDDEVEAGDADIGSTAAAPFPPSASAPQQHKGAGDLPLPIFASSSIRWHGKMCAIVFLVAAAALAGSVVLKGEKGRFFSFLLFELTVGLYYPILGTLRSTMIPEEYRATLSALFRVPLNLLVTLALVTGMESRREVVLFLSCCMLCGGSGVAWIGIVQRSDAVLR